MEPCPNDSTEEQSSLHVVASTVSVLFTVAPMWHIPILWSVGYVGIGVTEVNVGSRVGSNVSSTVACGGDA